MNKCKKHPRYQGIYAPRVICDECTNIFYKRNRDHSCQVCGAFAGFVCSSSCTRRKTTSRKGLFGAYQLGSGASKINNR